MEMKELSLVSPGEVLQEKFLEPLGISQNRLAREISVPARRIYEIVQGQRSISPEIALRLAHYFGLSKRFWLDLQARYDGKQEDRLLREFTKKQSLRYAR
jgi:antitoxin HigA-1